MNVKNNRRLRETDEKIIRIVYEMMTVEKMPVSKITVSEVCSRAEIHRSTFYAHYQDVYDLVDRVEENMSKELTRVFLKKLEQHACAKECFIELFSFIGDHREFYNFYLNESGNLGIIKIAWEMIRERYQNNAYTSSISGNVPEEVRHYHALFLLHGMSALVRLWLRRDCKESPEELYEILKNQSDIMKKMVEW